MLPASAKTSADSWRPEMMSSEDLHTPWICHVCDAKGSGQSLTCCNCFKVTCSKHLQHVPSYNRETGLYQLMPICLDCAIRDAIQ